ncbi:MAG: DUF2061 domain-containing protein [Bacteroidota bacterium]|uniref:DUF2061 domain-containing protein n=1 Tax=Flagellimonas okinawensis TaxID=3031324 RepID=A0ABT5XLV5_9FLAO|nr:DUF2061 domain-containing protein [[Muricauda] okinawensis]MDF0706875.1 DUF2061 domain-containing protein [[Muricauda] okinawensis]MEC8831357.1 DUF2061 domain-containing protein [Bacteroidota bacterium]
MTQTVSFKRHLAKTITWRLVGTLDTIMLSWAITGNPFTGLKIGLAEVITKMGLYYLHERFWVKASVSDSKKRHLIKTITWRILGTLDTIILSWVISGNPFTGLKIGFAEVITKMILYYFHERTWYKINYGLDKRKRAKKWKRTS